MTRLTLLTLIPLLLIRLIAHHPLREPTLVRYKSATALADAVDGRYKWKAITITPGITVAKTTITDLLALSLANNKCIGEVVITFRSGGGVSLSGPAGCEDQLGVGLSQTSHWERTGDTMTITEADGKRTRFALSFNGPLMRLSGKLVLDGFSDKHPRLLTMELSRQ